jgi:NAD+ diphosphatase
MIHDIYPEILSNKYYPKVISNESIVFSFQDGKLLCCEDKSVSDISFFPVQRQVHCDEYIYLFNLSGIDCYLAVHKITDLPDGYSYQDTRILRERETNSVAFAGVTAMHLYNWYSANRYCGRCSSLMEHDCSKRVIRCPSCGNRIYPKISPTVIVGVTNGDKILMTRYAGVDYRRYALVAGFIEIGESAEEAVKREVFEETGVKVKNIKYYKSQPWGYSDGLIFGYFAELDGEDSLTVDQTELSDAIWVHRDELNTPLDNFSLTNEMICHFEGHTRKNLPLHDISSRWLE